jgi:hypothetical protein
MAHIKPVYTIPPVAPMKSMTMCSYYKRGNLSFGHHTFSYQLIPWPCSSAVCAIMLGVPNAIHHPCSLAYGIHACCQAWGPHCNAIRVSFFVS